MTKKSGVFVVLTNASKTRADAGRENGGYREPALKRNSIKAIIATDIAALALSVIMLATLSFAWFFSSFTDERAQSIHIAKFEVKLDDSGEVAEDVKQTQTISVAAAFPRTFAQAKQAFTDGERNVYAFETENVGSLDAMVRLSAKIVSDSNAGADGTNGVFPLSGQIRYAVRLNRDASAFQADLSDFVVPTDEAGAVKGNLFTTAQDAANVSFQDYFNSLLLYETTGSAADADKRYRAKPEYVLRKATETDGVFSGGGKLYFQLMVWLDEDATVESTDVQIGGAPKKLEFQIVMHAMQSEGGAYFTHADVTAEEV